MEKQYKLFHKKIQKTYWTKSKANRRPPDHPVVIATFKPFAYIIAQSIAFPQKANILDIGCGNGFLQYALEEHFGQVVGMDFSQEMLNINPCLNKLKGTTLSLPFKDKSFDIVVASNLLHHLIEEERLRTLSEMTRVARYIIASFEPNRNNPFISLFALLNKEERMTLQFSSNYMEKLFKHLALESYRIFTTGWIVPNKAPICWIPIGRFLARSPLRKCGFDICCIGKISSLK